MDNVWSKNMPSLNDTAPRFKARTTMGEKTLDEYKGKWLLLFSHPADFTPVCTSEFISFAKAYDRFQALNCELLGLSVDSTYSHLAWVKAIKERFNTQIPFPIIEDVSMKIAHDYGMIQGKASQISTIRAYFLIDPNGIIQSMAYYPMANGRSVDEILRLLQAIQTSEAHGVATPEGWQPGDRAILPAPVTVAEMNDREKKGHCTDWYYTETSL